MFESTRPERHSLYRDRCPATSRTAGLTRVLVGILLAAPAALDGRTADLPGDWRLNYELSDDPSGHPPTADGERHPRRPRDQFGFQPPYDEFGRRRDSYRRPYLSADQDEDRVPGPDVREAFADLLTAPRRMTIVQRARDIVLRYDDGRVVRLVPDDRDHAGLAGRGVRITRKTRWDGAALRAEIRLESVPRVTHVLETQLEGQRLVVTTHVEPRGRYDGLEVRRVYDRAPAGGAGAR